MITPDRVAQIERSDGGRLQLRIYNLNARRTIVLSNGLGCGEVHWRHLLDDLSTDHRVVTWDYRGQGGSTEAEGLGAYSLGALAADLKAVQAVVCAVGAHHVGFGLGAVVALEHNRLAAKGEVASLTLIQGGMPPAWAKLPAASAMAYRLLSAAAPLSPWWLRAARTVRRGEWIHPVALRLQLVGATCDPEDFDNFLETIDEKASMIQLEIARGLAHHQPSDLFSKVKVPTLIFGAERDPLCPESLTLDLHERIQGSAYIPLPGASHATLLEVGPIIAGKIRRFLQE